MITFLIKSRHIVISNTFWSYDIVWNLVCYHGSEGAGAAEWRFFSLYYNILSFFCSVLIQRANQWLQQHGDVRVRTCESIEVKERGNSGGAVNTNKSTYWEPGKHSAYYVRCLRWVDCNPLALVLTDCSHVRLVPIKKLESEIQKDPRSNI